MQNMYVYAFMRFIIVTKCNFPKTSHDLLLAGLPRECQKTNNVIFGSGRICDTFFGLFFINLNFLSTTPKFPSATPNFPSATPNP